MRWVGICLLLAACADNSVSPDEREYQNHIDLENWYRCMKTGRTIHNNHSHRRGQTPRPLIVNQDLVVNHCQKRLGPHWID